MALLSEYAEIEEIVPGRFRHTQHMKNIAYRDNGTLHAIVSDWQDSGNAVRPFAVTTAPLMVTVAPDGMRRIHLTRELDRYVELGAPFIKTGGVWGQVNLGAPTRQGSRLQWTRPQANMYLDFGGHFLKLAILLKNGFVPEDSQIAFPVGMTGFTRQKRQLLRDEVVIANLAAPAMVDYANQEDVRPIDGQFVNLNGQAYWLMTLPDLTGMAQPLIDPTLTLQPDATSGYDCRIISNAPTFNYGLELLAAGENNGVSGQVMRSLIKFDLSSIPSNAVISATTVTLRLRDDRSNNSRLYRFYRQKRAWTEGTGIGSATGDGATWNTYNGVNAWQTAGGFGVNDCEQTDIGSLTLNATESTVYKNWSLTPTSVTDLDLGNGWMIKADTEVDDMWTFFGSDDTTAANRPQLVVDYTLPANPAISRGILRGTLRGTVRGAR